jgi:hypothetical protein
VVVGGVRNESRGYGVVGKPKVKKAGGLARHMMRRERVAEISVGGG